MRLLAVSHVLDDKIRKKFVRQTNLSTSLGHSQSASKKITIPTNLHMFFARMELWDRITLSGAIFALERLGMSSEPVIRTAPRTLMKGDMQRQTSKGP